MVRAVSLFCLANFILVALLTGPASAVEQPLKSSQTNSVGSAAAVLPASEASSVVAANIPVKSASPSDSMVTLEPDKQPADLVIRNRKILTLLPMLQG